MRLRYTVLFALFVLAGDAWAGSGTLIGIDHVSNSCGQVGGPIEVPFELDPNSGDWSATLRGYALTGTSSFGPDAHVFRLTPDFLSTIWIEAAASVLHATACHMNWGIGFPDAAITGSLKLNKLRTTAKVTFAGQGLGQTSVFRKEKKMKYGVTATGPWVE